MKWRKLGIVAGLSLTLIAAGCGQENTDASSDSSDSGDESASSVGEAVEYTITGIEPGAGIMGQAEQALEDYDNLSGWELENSSTGAMLTQLDEAIQNEEPIVITGWSPHYMFAQWDLKYLEDPEGSFGGEEQIRTIARSDLQEHMPEAYMILDQINWELEDLESALLEAENVDYNYDTVARQWVEQNPEKVSEWTEGVEPVDGTEITLATTSWDDALFTGNVAKVVLEQQGFDVSFTQVDPAILFESIASGDADASLSPWLPATHGSFYQEHEGEFEDLGPSVEGGRNGLTVPAYMDINSIEELEPNE